MNGARERAIEGAGERANEERSEVRRGEQNRDGARGKGGAREGATE